MSDSENQVEKKDQYRGLRPYDSQRAGDMSRLRWERAKRIGEPATVNPITGFPIDPNVPKMLNAAEVDREYTDKAFKGIWRKIYYKSYRELRSQYIPRGSKAHQYSILVQRCAALHVKIMQEEAKEEDKQNAWYLLRMEAALRDWIAQLQRYTEAERKEVYIKEEIVVTTLQKVVAIGEATIGDLAQRAAFMRGLAAMISDAPAQLPGPRVIEGESRPIEIPPSTN
jgi:hypothetical protein